MRRPGKPWFLAAGLCLHAGAAWASTTDLQGTWALELHVVSAASVPVIGDIRSTTVTYGLLEPTADEDGEAQRYSVCGVDLRSPTRLMRSSLPQAFLDALPRRIVHAEVDGSVYRVDLGATSLGFEPLSSAGRVPSDADDPAVRDHEGDGAPGFTVLVDVPLMPTVEVYLTQTTDLSLVGELVAPGRIVGRPTVSRLEQHVIGASHSAFGRSPVVHAVDDDGSFQLWRVPTGTHCDDLHGMLRWGER